MTDDGVNPDIARLADEYWAFHRNTAQLWNVDRGDVDQIDHWEDLSSDGTRSRVETLQWFARRANALHESAVGGDRILTAAVEFSATSIAATLPYMRDSSLVAGPMDAMTMMAVMVPSYGLATARQGQGYVTKLRSVPSFVDGWIDGLRDGAAVGRTATARGVTRAIGEVDRWLALPIGDDPMATQVPPVELSDREVAAWRADVLEAIEHDVRPALAALRTVLREEIAPVAVGDDRPGICHRLGGISDYDALLHAATSTSLTADAIHQMGRQQLARLDDEYALLGAEHFGISDPPSVRSRLRDDPALRYSSAEEIMTDAAAIVDRAIEAAQRWFATMPSADCAVTPVHGGGLAYYTSPSPDGGRGGTCYFNVADPSIWTRFSLEPTTFHESVPGHHLQLATAQERDLHPVLGELEVESFGEGWGLYAERLADEMGLYSGPLQRLGMLTLDSLRAARLVVDTGLHAMGWTRDEAIEFLGASTALVRRTVEGEIDRYIANPGQATSYMVGRLELERLRRTAEDRLGDGFSVGGFHDAVLGNGMCPLPALEQTVADWIAAADDQP
jgi:uncharacterized protein (DUF885 family)